MSQDCQFVTIGRTIYSRSNLCYGRDKRTFWICDALFLFFPY